MTKKMAISEIERFLFHAGLWWVNSEKRFRRLPKSLVVDLANILRNDGLNKFELKAFQYGLVINSSFLGVL